VLTSSPAVLLALALLVSATATAQPRAIPCETGIRRIELKTEPTGEVPELCISPGLSTTILFDGAELLPGGVSLEGQERFTLVDWSNTMLRLLPSERGVPGERFRVTVRFRDGAAPASAAFWLVVSPGQAERWVEVYRQQRTVESYQQEVKEKEAQLQQCREDNARLHAEKESPGGFAGLFATGLIGEEGVRAKLLTNSIKEHPRNAVPIGQVVSYRSETTVAVGVWLKPTEGTQPWTPVRAELVGPGRRTLSVKPPWQREPTAFKVEDNLVIIEADATGAETRGSFTLKLWHADGTRSVILSGVTFP
jgi:uncharacterized protein (TIGR02268 family)